MLTSIRYIFCNIFSYAVGSLFILKLFPSLCKNFLVWWRPTCLFLLLFLLLEETYSPQIADWCQKAHCPCFHLEFSWFQVVHFSPQFWVYLCTWHEKVAWFGSFTYSCPLFSTQFIADAVSSPLYVLYLLCHRLTVKVTQLCLIHFVTPCTVVHQAPLPMEFSGKEYWTG